MVKPVKIGTHDGAFHCDEVFACVMLSKPVEKILVRYDKIPTDFYSVLGPFPSRSYSPVGFRGPDGQHSRDHALCHRVLLH